MIKNRYLCMMVVISLGVLGLAATDIYIPALPQISHALNASSELTKLTLTSYFLGISLSPLVSGPLADKHGRKPIILICAGIGLLGTLLAAVSSHINVLILARLIQGIGLGSSMSLSRTITRDLFDSKELVKVISFFSFFLAIAPAVAPVVGGYLQFHFGWQSIFISIGCLILITGLIILVLIPETAPTLNPRATEIKQLFLNYFLLIKSPIFMGFICCSSMSIAGIIVFYALSPFIMQEQFHLTPIAYSWVVASITLMTLVSRMINLFLVKIFSIEHCMLIALGTMLIAGLSMLFLNWIFAHWLATIIIPMMLYTIGANIAFPNATAGAFLPFKNMGGVAGALYASLQMAGSFIATLVASFVANNVFIIAGIISFLSLFSLFIFIGFTISAFRKLETTF